MYTADTDSPTSHLTSSTRYCTICMYPPSHATWRSVLLFVSLTSAQHRWYSEVIVHCFQYLSGLTYTTTVWYNSRLWSTLQYLFICLTVSSIYMYLIHSNAVQTHTNSSCTPRLWRHSMHVRVPPGSGTTTILCSLLPSGSIEKNDRERL